MTKHHSDDFKLAIVQQVLKGKSIYSLVQEFNLSSRSIRRWIDKYNITHTVARVKRDVEAYKVENIHVKYAIEYLRKYPTVNLSDLHNHLKEKFPTFDITQQWLGKVLKDNNETRKRTRRYHEPITRYKKPINMCAVKNAFYDEISKNKINDIICMDETAVQLFMYKSYARCHLGRRCVITTESSKAFKSYTLLVAVKSSGLVGWRLYQEGGTSTERVLTFLEDYVYDKYTDNVIVMDNGPSHRQTAIRASIENHNNRLLYSVPYYPKANAIEMVFSQLKHYLRNAQTRTYEELFRAIHDVFETKIKTNNYKNYFKHAYEIKEQPLCRKKKSAKERLPPKYK